MNRSNDDVRLAMETIRFLRELEGSGGKLSPMLAEAKNAAELTIRNHFVGSSGLIPKSAKPNEPVK